MERFAGQTAEYGDIRDGCSELSREQLANLEVLVLEMRAAPIRAERLTHHPEAERRLCSPGMVCFAGLVGGIVFLMTRCFGGCMGPLAM